MSDPNSVPNPLHFGNPSIRILLFLAVAFKMQTKNGFLSKFFMLISHFRYINIIKSHKIVLVPRNLIFLLVIEGTVSLQMITDPDLDPRGPKTFGSGSLVSNLIPGLNSLPAI